MDRENLKKWAYDWANNDEIPDYAMSLFLDAAEQAVKVQPGVTSESLGDHSISYGDFNSILDATARSYLLPYRRVGFK